MGLAIALILALVTALVGPYFVNWNDYRSYFETEASRLVGLDVRVGGDIELRLLPFPSVRLADIEIGPNGQASRLRARSLGIEFGLGPLMRGEIRAVEMRLSAPQFGLGLNSLGRIDWPAMTLASETLSIDRLVVDDGRMLLTDAVSGTRLEVEKLAFTGQVRSLIGPLRGAGSFVAAGTTYAYRVAANRAVDDGMKFKFALDDSEQPLNIELEGQLAFDRDAPRFDGQIKLMRPAGAVQASGLVVAQEPWQLTGKVTANAQAAMFDQVAFQYGPEERAVKLDGAAEFKFGEQPRLHGTLSARQIDLDRLIATPEIPRRLPLAAMQNLAELFGGSLLPRLPVSVGVSVDAVTLGGAMLQNVGTDLRTDAGAWRFDKLAFRAPGFTQVDLSGRLDRFAAGLGFAGAASVDSNDPKTFVAWLAGRPGGLAQIKPWRMRGEFTLSPDSIAIERLQASFDRGEVAGRVAYFWPSQARPARLDAELSAGELDLDAVLQFGKSALSGLGLEWPKEVALAVDIDRARLAGFEAHKTQARLKFDAGGIAVERLSVADFGKATVQASGRIVTTPTPGGNIAIDLEARDLTGVIALADKFVPTLAETLRDLAGSQNNAKLALTISLDNAGSGSATGTLGVAGRIGAFRVDVNADATGKPANFTVTDLRALAGADTRIQARLESEDGNALLALIGLDRFAADEVKPARLDLSVAGPLSRQLRLDGSLASASVEAAAKGTIRISGDRPAIVELDDVSGTVGGSKVQGKLTFKLDDTTQVDGSIEAETIDVSVAIAKAIGMPSRRSIGAAAWPSEPFRRTTSELEGRIAFTAAHAIITSNLAAQQLRGRVSFGPSQVVFDDVSGELAGGRLDGRLALATGSDGIAARAQVSLSGADAAAVRAHDRSPPVTGQVSFQTEISGAGLSPAAFMGSLAGTGHIALENLHLASLNPRVFDAVTRAVELGIPTDAERIRQFVMSSLDNGTLPAARASAVVTVKDGRARLGEVIVRASGAELAVTANVDLAAATLDAVMTLSGTPASAGAVPPTIFVLLRGPLLSPTRSIEADALASWLALRAIERQSKQLDEIERQSKQLDEIERAHVEPAAQPTSRTSKPVIAPAVSPEVGGVLPAHAPPLPPAVNVRPLPRPRAADHSVPTSAQPPQPRTPRNNLPAPGRPLDLLGAQR
jgi:large subunit ribosomal protein L24